MINFIKGLFKKQVLPKYGPESFRNKIHSFKLTEDMKEIRRLIMLAMLQDSGWRYGPLDDIDSITIINEQENCRISLRYQDYFCITRADMKLGAARTEGGIFIPVDKDTMFARVFSMNILSNNLINNRAVRGYLYEIFSPAVKIP